jgi:hypothetical protein
MAISKPTIQQSRKQTISFSRSRTDPAYGFLIDGEWVSLELTENDR